jgi:hypothetical protein
MEGIWLIHADVSSYWMTLGKDKILEYISHSVGNSLWNRLWTCRKTDNAMNERVLHNGIHHSRVVCMKHANCVWKTKSQARGRFKLSCITLNYKAPRWRGQVGKFQLICAAVYFGRFSNSLTLWHTLNVTSADQQATVLDKFKFDIRHARGGLKATDQAVTIQTSRNTQSFIEFKVFF